ncbi:MAG: hypothetical protein CTY21_09450 [Methylomonas sp.]|nr:MAG: hypothetical protein CTY21_09450 [Methylomonas sp.]
MADWLKAEIVTGLQKLLALRLPGTPAEDMVIGTAEVWLEAVRPSCRQWDERLDAARIRAAFNALFRQADRWPAPKQFLDNLAARRPIKALSAPVYPADKAKDNLWRIRVMINSTVNTKTTAQEIARQKRKP